MNLRHLEVFHAVMRTASVTEAARLLNVSQPAVSTMLKHAEALTGIMLFQRIAGRLRPTPEAEALFADVKVIFAGIETFNRSLSNLRGGRSGTLSITATHTLANSLLPRAIAKFRKTADEVLIQVEAHSTKGVVDRIARRESDIGLVYTPTLTAGTDCERIGSVRIACVVPSAHKLAALGRVETGDVKGMPLITYGSATPLGSKLWEVLHEPGVERAPAIEVNSSMTACFLANEGAGVALIDPVIPLGGAFPDLVIRPFSPTIEIALSLLFPSNHPRSRLTLQFAKELRDMAGAMSQHA